MTTLNATAGAEAETAAAETVARGAAARTETALAWAWAGFRAGGAVAVAAAVAASPPKGARVVPETVLTVVLVLDCLVLGAMCLRLGRMPRGWMAFDLVCVIAVVGLSSWSAVLPGPAGQSYLYDFTVIIGPTIGLPAWPPLLTLAGGVGLAFVDFAPALRSGSSYPRWNALPDAVTIVGVALLAAVSARLLRSSAEALDRHREEAVERARLLARQRERIRQQADLSTHLMATVEALADGGVTGDPAIADRLRAEASGLRRLVAAEHVSDGRGLVAELRELVVEKAATGLEVVFEPADADVTLPPDAAAALVSATREALTNVRKHAGTNRAELTLAAEADAVSVTITDAGRGYDAAATAEGFGQRRSLRQRLAEVGGDVDIETAPGQGTRVRLSVPRVVVREESR